MIWKCTEITCYKVTDPKHCPEYSSILIHNQIQQWCSDGLSSWRIQYCTAYIFALSWPAANMLHTTVTLKLNAQYFGVADLCHKNDNFTQTLVSNTCTCMKSIIWLIYIYWHLLIDSCATSKAKCQSSEIASHHIASGAGSGIWPMSRIYNRRSLNVALSHTAKAHSSWNC